MRDAREHDPPRRITWDIITREAKKLIANEFQLLNPMKVFYSTSFMTACRFCISRTGHPALSEYELRDFARYMRENRLEVIELDLSEDEEEDLQEGCGYEDQPGHQKIPKEDSRGRRETCTGCQR